MNTTKDGIEVKPGQLWRDRDKRTNGRTIRIEYAHGGYAYFPRRGKGGFGRIAIARMHNKSTGFELVSQN